MTDTSAVSNSESPQSFVYDISGMHCAACSSRIERVLNNKDGLEAKVNLALERADVSASDSWTAETVREAIEKTGFGASLREGTLAERRAKAEALEEAHRDEERYSFYLFLFSALLTLPLVAPMVLVWFGLSWHLPPFWQFVLATPIQIIVGQRFYRGAWKALASGSANMDVLVALGTSAAYLFSLYQWITLGDGAVGHLYFEASAAILTLIVFGKWLEGRARRGAADALRALMQLRPQKARLIKSDGTEALVEVEALALGDIVRLLPGETVPVDGEIVEGRSEFDEALLSGESIPVLREAGEKVITGAINGSGAVSLKVTALGDDTVLARIIRLVDQAQTGRAKLQGLADRVSAIFVPVVVMLALVTFAVWLLFGGDMEQAVVASVSVLVIACPCALGLATPTALVAGTGAAARAGILIRDIDVLERAGALSHVLFDKTGTLTEGKPSLVEVRIIGEGLRGDILASVASLQASSEHPLAKACIEVGKELEFPIPKAENVKAHVGEGVEGVVSGKRLLVGTDAFLACNGVLLDGYAETLSELQEQGLTISLVSRNGILQALLGFRDEPRQEAFSAINDLKNRGLKVGMLSGDAEMSVAHLAEALELDEAHGRISPQGKLDRLESLQNEGHHVGMVGDGLNDAPALAKADVSFAMGSGTDVAIGAASITLMRSDPRLVASALDIAAKTHRKIWQNLFWAFIYNVIGIPLAAFGLLNPALAGAAMAFSSVSVVSNALLLRRWRAER